MIDLDVLVPVLGTVLVDFLWQGALVGLLAWLALALLRNARPQARYSVACIALAACLLLPAWQLMRALGNADSVSTTPSAVDAAIAAPAPAAANAMQAFAVDALPSLPEASLPWIVALWAAGVGALALRMVGGVFWVRRLRMQSQPGQDAWQARVDALARRFGIRRVIALRIVAAGDGPLSAGCWKPMVLLPAALVLRMPTQLLEALIAHELAHIRRHDYLVNLLQCAVEALLFYHPVTWWLSRRIRIEREQVADAIAAAVLGEPRRLAVALSELDRYAVSFPTFAQAAHGGQLMSRIQQLVRPDRRNIGGIVALPLLGLAAAGIVFAQVHSAPAADQATTMVHAGARAQAAAAPLPEPHPAAQGGALAQSRPVTLVSSRSKNEGSGYALVREGQEGFSMSGDLGDVDTIRAARRSIGGDFLWFRRDGKSYVVRDAALLARAQVAWAPTQELEVEMQDYEAKMRPHQEKLQALSERMDALQVDNAFDSPEMKASTAAMEALGSRMEAVTQRQVALAMRMQDVDQSEYEDLQRQGETLGAQQEAISREFEQHSRKLEAASRRMEAQAEPMEVLGREMEAASQPMESLGKGMEMLGKRMEARAAVADAEIRKVIDEAIDRRLAMPAPQRQ